MSSSLGQGFVALTPINLDTVPSQFEGSKAGLLTLYWANVKAANKQYSQPVNLLQSYQTGQFTTVQAILVDNSQVAYPVLIVSQSTGQRVTVAPYTTQMAPLLVSVAPQFTISLLIPSTVTTPLDQAFTYFFFLNTPQVPWSATLPTPVTTANTLLASGNVAPPVNFPTGTFTTIATLVPGFTAGSAKVTYVSITIAAQLLAALLDVGNTTGPGTIQFRTIDSGSATWLATWSVPQTPMPQNYSTTFTYPANVNDTGGGPILLQMSAAMTGGFSTTTQANVSVVYSFYYTVTQ